LDKRLGIIFVVIEWIYHLAIAIVLLAVFWRRLHDIGRAEGWCFIG
jgi:uncharacterized membrane protein YhaH (DUF805 family)